MVKIPAILLLIASSLPLAAQWPDYRDPGIPRTKDGKPNLSAPSPEFRGLIELSASGSLYSYGTGPRIARTELLNLSAKKMFPLLSMVKPSGSFRSALSGWHRCGELWSSPSQKERYSPDGVLHEYEPFSVG